MKKRVVSLLMICALSVGMLAGCGSSETQNQATGSADNTQTDLLPHDNLSSGQKR